MFRRNRFPRRPLPGFKDRGVTPAPAPQAPRVHKIEVELALSADPEKYGHEAIKAEDMHVEHYSGGSSLTFYRRADTFIAALLEVVTQVAESGATVESVRAVSSYYGEGDSESQS
jgi:hypothetical protein